MTMMRSLLNYGPSTGQAESGQIRIRKRIISYSIDEMVSESQFTQEDMKNPQLTSPLMYQHQKIAEFNRLPLISDVYTRLANDFIMPKKRNQGIRRRELHAPSDVYGAFHNAK